MDNQRSKTIKHFYIVAINWEKAKNEKINSMERLHYVKILRVAEGEDIANYVQYFDDYADGWRVYLYSSRRQAERLFEITMKK